MANLNEDLKRYKQLLGYDPKIGGASINEKRYHSYAEDTEGATEEEGAEEEETTEEEGAEEKVLMRRPPTKVMSSVLQMNLVRQTN